MLTHNTFSAFVSELAKLASRHDPIPSALARQNIDATTGALQGATGSVGNYLKTKGGRNVALGALGVGTVAGATLLARKKLKDMKHGSRERRMRELSQGQ